MERGTFDLVTTRAVLHHVADARAAIANMVASLETITELRSDLIASGKLDAALIDKFLAYCSDSNWWTQTIAFTAVHGRTLGG